MADAKADPEVAPESGLEKENRVLERRLRRMEANVRQLEEFQDSNATLLSRLVRDLEEERARSRQLLLNVLPERIVQRLEAGESRIADRYDSVTVLFSDFVDFTRIAAELEPLLLIDELNALFSAFDEVCDRNGVEKIKTIGDAYLVVGGLSGTGDATRAAAETALGMCACVARAKGVRADWRVRIGIHTGSLVAGVVGTSRFAYDIWGDTVNMASRLEASSRPGRIQVSTEVARELEPDYVLERRGIVAIKGKGPAETWFLEGRRASAG